MFPRHRHQGLSGLPLMREKPPHQGGYKCKILRKNAPTTGHKHLQKHLREVRELLAMPKMRLQLRRLEVAAEKKRENRLHDLRDGCRGKGPDTI
ncbi:unnamed protein product [Phytomonas sp. Hart1]|nr:unnamed protein product [Phytomonas sp. Hart1]|eukprot:CCW70745.1 unnamed protein product [Phytomonas sp. isolate Hart1]